MLNQKSGSGRRQPRTFADLEQLDGNDNELYRTFATARRAGKRRLSRSTAGLKDE